MPGYALMSENVSVIHVNSYLVNIYTLINHVPGIEGAMLCMINPKRDVYGQSKWCDNIGHMPEFMT